MHVISGYASPTMASWHMKQINHLSLPPVQIALTVGMCPFDGLKVSFHEGFKELVSFNQTAYSALSCNYVCQGPAVHSKIYVWMKEDRPFRAYTGSANYTQSGFSNSRREYMVPCNPEQAYDYISVLDPDTIICNHSEVEESIILHRNHAILDAEDQFLTVDKSESLHHVTLSLLTRYGDVGFGSGINWGHRRNGAKREPNQAYISLPVSIAQSGFFPLNKQHFTVITDDRKQLILRVEQQNDKAITTPLNNSHIGEYFRNRIGVPNGAFVSKQDLKRYGRTDVTFYKIDDEQFFMDFSV